MKKERVKISITLNDQDSELFRRVLELPCEHPPGPGWRGGSPRRNWRVAWMIRAMLAAIARHGAFPFPLAAELRFETPEETAERVARSRQEPQPSRFGISFFSE